MGSRQTAGEDITRLWNVDKPATAQIHGNQKKSAAIKRKTIEMASEKASREEAERLQLRYFFPCAIEWSASIDFYTLTLCFAGRGSNVHRFLSRMQDRWHLWRPQ